MKALPLLLLAAVVAACSEATEDRPDEVRPVRVIRIGVTEGARRIEYAGEVRARYETRVAFRVPGKIVERLVEVGSRVQPGQPVSRRSSPIRRR